MIITKKLAPPEYITDYFESSINSVKTATIFFTKLTRKKRLVMSRSIKNILLLCCFLFVNAIVCTPILGQTSRGKHLALGELGVEDGAAFSNYFQTRNEPKNYGALASLGGYDLEQPVYERNNIHVLQGRNGQVKIMPPGLFQWKMYQG